jgi:hypothetical protein
MVLVGFGGGAVAERGVEAARVVPALDPLEHGPLEPGAGSATTHCPQGGHRRAGCASDRHGPGVLRRVRYDRARGVEGQGASWAVRWHDRVLSAPGTKRARRSGRFHRWIRESRPALRPEPVCGRCDRPPTSSRNTNAPATARYRTQSCGMPLEDAWSFDPPASSSSRAYLPPTS